ncbi:hypothetical protein Bhyg_04787 [Pseudolycoriella hygida]|uniref:Uncharacterized protein n=1 Tax=Pseudolycoriella hygida TaxID=35572 RepID=A0A9Q0SAA9_9DIPT|nr:hypothetical protein Bhyg_04787 [Pseudolycoriella hygida]
MKRKMMRLKLDRRCRKRRRKLCVHKKNYVKVVEPMIIMLSNYWRNTMHVTTE